MAHTFTNLLTHIVFGTKHRHAQIDPDLKPRLLAYMGGIIRERKGIPMILNGASDHVHILAKVPPTEALSDLMREVKTNSSRWVHEAWPQRRDFAWQAGFSAFSVSQSNVESVSRYIARQEEHHRQVSFAEEYVAFLRRHGIEFDERYLSE